MKNIGGVVALAAIFGLAYAFKDKIGGSSTPQLVQAVQGDVAPGGISYPQPVMSTVNPFVSGLGLNPIIYNYPTITPEKIISQRIDTGIAPNDPYWTEAIVWQAMEGLF